MAVDPALQQVAAAILALVLLTGAGYKLRDLSAFEIDVDNYALLPGALVRPVAWLLPGLEVLAGLMLVSDAVRAPGALLALALLAVVTAAVAINLVRGRTDVGCGCGGLEDEQPLSWALVARNALLALLALAALAGAAARPLTWIDYLTVACGALAGYGIYVAANQLIANRPRLARLRPAR